MGLGEEIGNYGRHAPQMPLPIVQGAQYMNDATSAVLGKLTQARYYQKCTEFRGGIWDCSPVKETLISRPPCVDSLNKTKNKILSLEEILACDDEEIASEIKKDDLFISESAPSESSANVSCDEMIVDSNHKRWRSEEFDKTYLLPSHENEVTRKKSKKNVSFSDDVLDLETSSKIKRIEPDIIVIEDEVGILNKTQKENKRMKNVGLFSEDAYDIPVKMDDKVVSEKKSAVNKSAKVENWIHVVSQSSKNPLPDQQLYNQKKRLEEKSLSKERCRSRKIKSNNCIVEHVSVMKTDVTNGVSNEELKNLSRLETVLPEILDFVESDNEIEQKATNKILEDKLMPEAEARKLNNIPSFAQEIRKSSRKKSPAKGVSPPIEIDLTKESKTEPNSFEKDNSETMTQKEKEKDLLNVLLKFFNNDEDFAESIKSEVVKLAGQKNKIDVKSEKYGIKSLFEEQQLNCISVVEHNASFVEKPKKKSSSRDCKLEDESQYAVPKEKPPIAAKQTFKDLNSERNEGMGKCNEIEVIVEKASGTSGKVSPNLHPGEDYLQFCL